LRSHYDEPDKRRQAMEAVARLIREQIVAPQGAPPRGNLHLHCGGGMHRTGMIAGVLERCVNGTPLPVVEANYRYHVGYRDAAHPGGLEEGNLRFIRDFDCALLQSGGTATTESGPRR
jgi:protein tyrosine/serine phosphatase